MKRLNHWDVRGSSKCWVTKKKKNLYIQQVCRGGLNAENNKNEKKIYTFKRET